MVNIYIIYIFTIIYIYSIYIYIYILYIYTYYQSIYTSVCTHDISNMVLNCTPILKYLTITPIN